MPRELKTVRAALNLFFSGDLSPEIILFYSREVPENQEFRADRIIFMFTLLVYFRSLEC